MHHHCLERRIESKEMAEATIEVPQGDVNAAASVHRALLPPQQGAPHWGELSSQVHCSRGVHGGSERIAI